MQVTLCMATQCHKLGRLKNHIYLAVLVQSKHLHVHLCVIEHQLTALSGSLPIKENISATVDTKVLFTSESIWSSGDTWLCFFWTFVLHRCNLRTSCMPSWTDMALSSLGGADRERQRSGEEGVWSSLEEVAATCKQRICFHRQKDTINKRHNEK